VKICLVLSIQDGTRPLPLEERVTDNSRLLGKRAMAKRRLNWPLWAGFLVSGAAFASYFLFFAQFPTTRDFPWVNFLLFAAAAVLVVLGLQRAFVSASSYRGKISGLILAALSAVILGFFCFSVFVESRQLPLSEHAPRVGQKAPQFSLPDTNGRSESLSELLSTPIDAPSASGRVPKGVLLVFYRGYW
jgi:hypothetical protein